MNPKPTLFHVWNPAMIRSPGAAALMAQAVKTAEVVAYEDLGTEAIRRLEVEDFPAVVVNDCYGGDLYKEGMDQYRID